MNAPDITDSPERVDAGCVQRMVGRIVDIWHRIFWEECGKCKMRKRVSMFGMGICDECWHAGMETIIANEQRKAREQEEAEHKRLVKAMKQALQEINSSNAEL